MAEAARSSIISTGYYEQKTPYETISTQMLSSYTTIVSPKKSLIRTSSDIKSVAENKSHRGLRLYGKLVFDKVKEKGITTFDEVADEIYKDLARSEKCDMIYYQATNKSVRRRVYDALNVLFALDMISKDGRAIQWVGESASQIQQEQQDLERERRQLEKSIQEKTTEVKDVILQIIAYQSLLLTKKEVQKEQQKDIIHLPFIVVKAPKDTDVTCSVSTDKFEHIFTFDQPFEIQDDIEVLKRMGFTFGLENTEGAIENLELHKAVVSYQLQSSTLVQETLPS